MVEFTYFKSSIPPSHTNVYFGSYTSDWSCHAFVILYVGYVVKLFFLCLQLHPIYLIVDAILTEIGILDRCRTL
jgi:hypothetical protein